MGLHSGSKDVQWVDNTCAECAAHRTNKASGSVVERDVIFMAMFRPGLPCENGSFEIFECTQVDGGVGKHADKAQRQAAEEPKKAMFGPHFFESGYY